MGSMTDWTRERVHAFSKAINEITRTPFQYEHGRDFPLSTSGKLEIMIPEIEKLVDAKYAHPFKDDIVFSGEDVETGSNLSTEQKKKIETVTHLKNIKKRIILMNHDEGKLVLNELQDNWTYMDIGLLMGTIRLWQSHNSDSTLLRNNDLGINYEDRLNKQSSHAIDKTLALGQIYFIAEQVLKNSNIKGVDVQKNLKHISKKIGLDINTFLARNSYLKNARIARNTQGYDTYLTMKDLMHSEVDITKVMKTTHGMDPSNDEFIAKYHEYREDVKDTTSKIWRASMWHLKGFVNCGLAARVGYQIARDLHEEGIPQVNIIKNMPQKMEDVGKEYIKSTETTFRSLVN